MSAIAITQRTIAGQVIQEAVAGDGPDILMLHGWMASIELVWPLAQRLITAGYRVYIPAMPGMGASADLPQPWTLPDYANFVRAYAASHDLTSFFLFGHSFGGRLGLYLGAEDGAMIRKMVLANSAGVLSKTPLTARLRLQSYKAIRDGLYRLGARGLADHLRQRYNARYGSTDFNAVSGIMRQTLVNVVNADMLPYAARVRPSTLLIWGDQDTDTPLWQGQMLEETIPDAGLVVHAGAGHYSYLDRVVETARIMAHFFGQDD